MREMVFFCQMSFSDRYGPPFEGNIFFVALFNFIVRVFALQESNLKFQASNPAERTLKEEFAENGIKYSIRVNGLE